VPGIDCREENCQAIPWGGGTAWLNKIVYSIPDVPNYYSDSACTQSIDPYSYCTAVGGGGVPYFNTDLDNNNTTNSLDWAILVTGWTKGKYNALDASLFLWNWAGQN